VASVSAVGPAWVACRSLSWVSSQTLKAELFRRAQRKAVRLSLLVQVPGSSQYPVRFEPTVLALTMWCSPPVESCTDGVSRVVRNDTTKAFPIQLNTTT